MAVRLAMRSAPVRFLAPIAASRMTDMRLSAAEGELHAIELRVGTPALDYPAPTAHCPLSALLSSTIHAPDHRMERQRGRDDRSAQAACIRGLRLVQDGAGSGEGHQDDGDSRSAGD